MTLTRLLMAWVVIGIWYSAVDWGLGRYRPARGSTVRPWIIVTETLLLTLFAALWFGSLGHGGWWLLFLVLGIFVEGPVRARHRSTPVTGDTRPWHDVLFGVVRLVIAGGLLSWILS